MNATEIYQMCRSGVVHVVFVRDGKRVASGSALVSSDRVITNNHVFAGPPDSDVVIRFHDSNPDDLHDGIVLSRAGFSSRLVTGSDETQHDYAILDVPEVVGKVGFQFVLGQPDLVSVGQSIAFLGYPFEHLNLVFHLGVVSSRFRTGATEIIQLDASVNPSNSGGPLLELDSGTVVGVVTRRATGLTDTFKHLAQAFDDNIAALQATGGASMSIGGVDPVQALVVGQHQMKEITKQIERSANVGIGYAFSIEHIGADPIWK